MSISENQETQYFDIIGKVPFLTGDTEILDEKGIPILISNIKYGDNIQTSDGISNVLKIVKVRYEGDVYSYFESKMTGGTPFMTSSGYIDLIKYNNDSICKYKGYLYNIILENNGLIKIPQNNESVNIFVGSCGFRFSELYFVDSLFHGFEIWIFLISNYYDFIITLEPKYFKYNEESYKVELDFKLVQNNNYINKLYSTIFYIVNNIDLLLNTYLERKSKINRLSIFTEDNEEVKKRKEWMLQGKHNVETDHLEKGTYLNYHSIKFNEQIDFSSIDFGGMDQHIEPV